MIKNLFAPAVRSTAGELFETLLRTRAFTLERIVSFGQATPAGAWFDQDRDEWVALLSGSAGLLFENEVKARTLKPGDYLLIPAHVRHRVEWTERGVETVWLALHYSSPASSQEDAP